MKIKKLEVTNFGSYRHLELDLENQGLTLIHGATGSGKSTILDAILWCLYGQTAKNTGADDVKSWTSKEATTGTIQVSNGRVELEIRRTRGKGINDLYWTERRNPTSTDTERSARIHRGKGVNDLSWTQSDASSVSCTSVLELSSENQEVYGHPPGGGRIDQGKGINDLFYTMANEHALENQKFRGKDLTETQKLLSERLGVDAEGFVGACYYHEFSPEGSFFTANAKARRGVFEALAELGLPTRLRESSGEQLKQLRKNLDSGGREIGVLIERINNLRRQSERLSASETSWEVSQKAKINQLKAKASGFEEEKAIKVKELEIKKEAWNKKHEKEINDASEELDVVLLNLSKAPDYETVIERAKEESRCKSCGELGKKSNDVIIKNTLALGHWNTQLALSKKMSEQIERMLKEVNPFISQYNTAFYQNNFYENQLIEEQAAINPFTKSIKDVKEEIKVTEASIKTTGEQVEALTYEIAALEQIQDLTDSLRAVLVTDTVRTIQEDTNKVLQDYFDGELTVEFTVTGSDNLDVQVYKSGYECNFKQLSKGQRQLLRLSFWLAASKARANRLGQHFPLLMLDEPTDGLDGEMKVKAYRLMEHLALEHDSVLVIDHNEAFKACVSKKLHVTMEADTSTIHGEQE